MEDSSPGIYFEAKEHNKTENGIDILNKQYPSSRIAKVTAIIRCPIQR